MSTAPVNHQTSNSAQHMPRVTSSAPGQPRFASSAVLKLCSAGSALLLVLCSASAAHSQEWAEKMFSTLRHDFGVVARGADVRYQIIVTNRYVETVHISDVRTTCGCTAATPNRDTLASRETAVIEVTMDTRKFQRQKDSNLIVTFDQPFHAEVKIPIAAYIRTDVVLEPGAVDFGAVARGSSPSRTVSVAYAGRNDWQLRGVQSRNPQLEAKVVEKSRGNGRVNYELLVTLRPDVALGAFREQLTLITDDANNPQIPLLVSGKVEAEYTVTPEVVSFGRLVPGQKKTLNVVLRSKKPFGIGKIECGSDTTGAFEVPTFGTETKAVHVVPLTFSPPAQPGKMQEEFTVTVAGTGEEIIFKAYAEILDAAQASP